MWAVDMTPKELMYGRLDVINEALQIASMLVEHLNPDLALQYYLLPKGLKVDAKKHG